MAAGSSQIHGVLEELDAKTAEAPKKGQRGFGCGMRDVGVWGGLAVGECLCFSYASFSQNFSPTEEVPHWAPFFTRLWANPRGLWSHLPTNIPTYRSAERRPGVRLCSHFAPDSIECTFLRPGGRYSRAPTPSAGAGVAQGGSVEQGALRVDGEAVRGLPAGADPEDAAAPLPAEGRRDGRGDAREAAVPAPLKHKKDSGKNAASLGFCRAAGRYEAKLLT